MRIKTDQQIITLKVVVILREKYGCFWGIKKALETTEGQRFVIEQEQKLISHKTIGI